MKVLGRTEEKTDVIDKQYVDDLIELATEDVNYAKSKSEQALKKVEDISKDITTILEKMNKKIAGEGGG
jgi:hypothetical protein